MKTTQRKIKHLIEIGEVLPLETRPKHFDVVAVSTGANGLNGCIIKDTETKQLYGLATRSSFLLSIV